MRLLRGHAERLVAIAAAAVRLGIARLAESEQAIFEIG